MTTELNEKHQIIKKLHHVPLSRKLKPQFMTIGPRKTTRELRNEKIIPGAIWRRDWGGAQLQTHGGQAEEALNFKPLLNLKYRAGPDTQSAETTAKITKQQRRQAPDLLFIFVCGNWKRCEIYTGSLNVRAIVSLDFVVFFYYYYLKIIVYL